MIDYRDISRRLAAIGKDRRWLAKRLNLSTNTVRQYLGPKGKRTKEFLEEIERVMVLEEARQRENRADTPPWNVLFKTADEFDRVDRASRRMNAESIIEFCRDTLLNRADEILEAGERGRYPVGHIRSIKVAEEPPDKTGGN